MGFLEETVDKTLSGVFVLAEHLCVYATSKISGLCVELLQNNGFQCSTRGRL
jgi:hypothetical protein